MMFNVCEDCGSNLDPNEICECVVEKNTQSLPLKPMEIGGEYGPCPQPESFTIDNPVKADWAIEKIKDERKRRDLFIEAAQSRIDDLTAQIDNIALKCDNNTAFLISELGRYLDIAPAKQTKTQRVLELPSGKLLLKLPKVDFILKDEDLMKYLNENAAEYIEIKPQIKWGEFKKDLQISGGTVVRKSTGEVLDCINTVETPAHFEVI